MLMEWTTFNLKKHENQHRPDMNKINSTLLYTFMK